MRAEFQRSYLLRYAGLAAVCLGLGMWFAYDGFVGYPRALERAEAFEQLSDLSSRDIETRWAELTEEKGWPNKRPEKKAEEIRSDITGQYFWFAINLVVGLPALYLLLTSRGRWIEATDQGLKTSWGQSLSFADVKLLNKRRWQKKGIAIASYTENGTSRTFIFDDFKYDREPIGQMLRKLEAGLSAEQITGGPSELEEDAAKTEAATDVAGTDEQTE